MVGLGYELAEAGWRVLATTTTKLSTDQLDLFPCTMSAMAAPRTDIGSAYGASICLAARRRFVSGHVLGPAGRMDPEPAGQRRLGYLAGRSG